MAEEKKISVKPTVAFVYDDVTHRSDPRMAKAIDQFLKILEMEASYELDRVTTRIVPLSEYSELHFSERNSARLFVGFFPVDTPTKIDVKIPFTEQDKAREEVAFFRDVNRTHREEVIRVAGVFGDPADEKYRGPVSVAAERYYIQGWHMGEQLLRVAVPALHRSSVAFHEDLKKIKSVNQGHGNRSSRLILIGLMFGDAADLYPKLVTRHRISPNRPNLDPITAMWAMWAKVSLQSPCFGCPDRIITYDTRDFPLRLDMERNLTAFDQLLGDTLLLIRYVSRDAPLAALETIMTLGLANRPKFTLVSHRLEDPRVLLLVAAMCDSLEDSDPEGRQFIKYQRCDAAELESPAEICSVAVIFDQEHPYDITDRARNTILFYAKHQMWDVRRRGRRF